MKTKVQTLLIILSILTLFLVSNCGSGIPAKPFMEGSRPIQPTVTRPTPTKGSPDGSPLSDWVRIIGLKAVNCNEQGVRDLCEAYKESEFSITDEICLSWKEFGNPPNPPGVLNFQIYRDGEYILGGQYDEIGNDECQSHEIYNLAPGEYEFVLEQLFPSVNQYRESWIISTPIPSATPTKTPLPTATPILVETSTPVPTLTPLITDTLEVKQWLEQPKIDGDLAEWADVTSYETAYIVHSTDTWDGSDDLRAIWRLSWDEKYLYLGVDVIDDIHVQTQSDNQIYKGDSLTILFDPQQDSDSGPEYYMIDLSPGNFNSQPPSSYRYGYAEDHYIEAPGHSIEVWAIQTKQGYSLEAAIPWDDIDLVPASGLEIGIILIAADNDTPETAVREVEKSNVEDTGTWGSITIY
jgi:hypothetical protein